MDWRRLALRQGQLEKCRMLSPQSPCLETGAAVRWSRLKIATNVGSGVICSPEPRQPPGPFEPKKTAAVRSDGP